MGSSWGGKERGSKCWGQNEPWSFTCAHGVEVATPQAISVFSRVPVVGLSFPFDSELEEISIPWPLAVAAGLFWGLLLSRVLASALLTTSCLRQGHPQWW